MATIAAATNEKVFQIKQWLGLNENPDGDTKLKMGEASVMRNWRVTRDGNLQKRPGTKEVIPVPTWQGSQVEYGKTVYVWQGQFGRGMDCLLWVNELFFALFLRENGVWNRRWLYLHPDGVSFLSASAFSFNDKMYFKIQLSPDENNPNRHWRIGVYERSTSGTYPLYLFYDDALLTTYPSREPYVPLVQTATTPEGAGTLLEQVNKLTPRRRVWFSPDGTATTFQLPEKNLARIDSAKLTATGASLTISSSSTANGTLTLSAAPTAGVNTIEVIYTASADDRGKVLGMKCAETYNGTQDTRLFLYGDGTNQAIYSGIDYNGSARADYFPDNNVVNVGVANTPITAMIRHYGKLAVFKTDGAYHIQYGVISTALGDVEAAFYVTPVNKTIGNVALGQVQLVLQSPITLFGTDLYEWKNNNAYAANLSTDERQVRRVSDKVFATLRKMDLSRCETFDDNYHQEYYVSDPSTGKTLVWNYAANAWYLYTNFYLHCPFMFQNKLYFANSVGGLQVVDEAYAYDQYGADAEKQPIDCYWESGSMSFGMDYQRKYSAMLWLGIKPEARGSVDVTVQTDRSNVQNEKSVSTWLVSFARANFADWTFDTGRRPKMKRLKIKAKKFVYYNLILKNQTTDDAATVTSADIRVRYTGYTK